TLKTTVLPSKSSKLISLAARVRFKQRRFFDETTLFLGLPAKVGTQQARQLCYNNYFGLGYPKTNKNLFRDKK
ncbi:hypothetical protein, partial [Marinilabilia sp.]|uniref:hypothetical protein n=1 Tax=Marinilabilia sp. TaxID=2021252 RepID=UPI0025C4F424